MVVVPVVSVANGIPVSPNRATQVTSCGARSILFQLPLAVRVSHERYNSRIFDPLVMINVPVVVKVAHVELASSIIPVPTTVRVQVILEVVMGNVYVIENCEAAVLLLLLRSLHTPAAISTVTVPSLVGVTSNVYLLPLTVTKLLRDQLDSVTSLEVNQLTVLENCAIIWIFPVVGLLVVDESTTLGAAVSCTIIVLFVVQV